jgi:hypothetical protein
VPPFPDEKRQVPKPILRPTRASISPWVISPAGEARRRSESTLVARTKSFA